MIIWLWQRKSKDMYTLHFGDLEHRFDGKIKLVLKISNFSNHVFYRLQVRVWRVIYRQVSLYVSCVTQVDCYVKLTELCFSQLLSIQFSEIVTMYAITGQWNLCSKSSIVRMTCLTRPNSQGYVHWLVQREFNNMIWKPKMYSCSTKSLWQSLDKCFKKWAGFTFTLSLHCSLYSNNSNQGKCRDIKTKNLYSQVNGFRQWPVFCYLSSHANIFIESPTSPTLPGNNIAPNPTSLHL